MDKEQEELQFLSLLGIYTEACKLIIKWRKIFTQITLALILPLSSLILLEHKHKSITIFSLRIGWYTTDHGLAYAYSQHEQAAARYIFKSAYLSLHLALSPLSTSAVICTVACMYASRETTVRNFTITNIKTVVLKVWKRLFITFLCNHLTFFALPVPFALTASAVGHTFLWGILLYYPIGIAYMEAMFQLAGVVTVLEESYGFEAMVRSKDLIKGKMMASIVVFLNVYLSLMVIDFVFRVFVVEIRLMELGNVQIVGIGILLLLLKAVVTLFGLVLQTVLYFVCKSNDRSKNIDNSGSSFGAFGGLFVGRVLRSFEEKGCPDGGVPCLILYFFFLLFSYLMCCVRLLRMKLVRFWLMISQS